MPESTDATRIVESHWISENLMDVDEPWKYFIGALIWSSEGVVWRVISVKIRTRPLEPLLRVTNATKQSNHTCLYSIEAFRIGRFQKVELSPDQVCDFTESIEKLRSLKRKGEQIHKPKEENLAEFDLLLFDLDDTLLATSHLESFRGCENIWNNSQEYLRSLEKTAESIRYLVKQQDLSDIKQLFSDLKFGVLTRAPRAYAETLLSNCYPDMLWDVLIAYEDVKVTKPHPDGILKASSMVGVTDLRRVAFVGNEKSDLIAAYRAGCFAILSRQIWGKDWESKKNPNRRSCFKSNDLIADAVIDYSAELPEVIRRPWLRLPALEAWQEASRRGEICSTLRTDRCNHFNDLEPLATSRNWVQLNILGRYFPSSRKVEYYDFTAKRKNHVMSQKIIDAKDGDEYPDFFVECLSKYITSQPVLRNTIGITLTVSVIPARPGRLGRLERLLERIENLTKRKTIVFDQTIFRFKDGVLSNSKDNLSRSERFENIRDHLLLIKPDKMRGQVVMVIDDVATSGATLYYAHKLLKQSGATEVILVVLAQTIS